MLLTDNDYPRAYGLGDIVYYIVVHPGAQSLWVHGASDDSYVVGTARMTTDEAVLRTGECATRVPLTPKLAQEARDMWNLLYAPD